MATSEEFKRLKERSEHDLEFLLNSLRSRVGQHKRTKLKILGQLASKTLLDTPIAKKHAERLADQFFKRWVSPRKAGVIDRLRFFTVLSELVELDLDATDEAVERMFSKLKWVFQSVKGIEVIGAAEIEIVNIRKLSALRSTADEARKLDVVYSMLPAEEKSLFKKGTTSYALIHFHGIVDLGVNAEEKAKELSSIARQYWNQPYMVELKNLYSTKSLKKNLIDIAAYLTKGGNENLIYKIGFGYDSDDKLERQMLKAGIAAGDVDYAGIENELSLTNGEIKFLGEAIERLMTRTGSKNMRNGYLFKYGQQQRWLR